MSIMKSLLLMLLVAANSSANALTLEWEIGNRYRAFDYLASGNQDSLESMKLFEKYAPRSNEVDFRQWLARLLEEPTGSRSISPFAGKAGPWSEQNGQIGPNYKKDFVNLPSSLAIKVTLKATTPNEAVPSGDCELRSGGKMLQTGSCNETFTLPSFPSTGGSVQLYKDGNLLSSTAINPSLKVILGLGDSYAAGEGAPDFPTVWAKNISENAWPLGKADRVYDWPEIPASWWSNRCNRSFFSAQSMTALRLAQDDPHSVVSFVHLACAGAEVIDGLLSPQRMAPGRPVTNCKAPRSRNTYSQLDPKCDVPVSQLRAAVELLCETSPVAPSKQALASIRQPLNQIRVNKDQRVWINDLRACPSGNLRKPDLVLVGIGGNDAGFSGVIAWGLIPIGSRHPGLNLRKITSNFVTGIARNKVGVVCPKKDMVGCGKEAPAYDRIGDLPHRYEALANALNTLLSVSGNQIVMPNYPNPLFDEEGNICGNAVGENRNNEWYATRMLIPPVVSPKKWQINLTKWEAAAVNKWVVEPLNKTVLAEGNKHKWVTPDVSDAMMGHGWCVGPDRELLKPQLLTNWDGYMDRVRMIRISNDTVSTQWPDKNRADWISGTFHPNAWGYAAVANEMVKAIGTSGVVREAKR